MGSEMKCLYDNFHCRLSSWMVRKENSRGGHDDKSLFIATGQECFTNLGDASLSSKKNYIISLLYLYSSSI